MKSKIIVLFMFLNSFSYAQTLEFDKIIIENNLINGKSEKNEISTKGKIELKHISVDISYNGIKQTMKLDFIGFDNRNSLYGIFRYFIDDSYDEELVIYFYKNKIYAVEIYRRLGMVATHNSRIKYIITK